MARRDGRRVWLGFQWDAVSWESVSVWSEYLLQAIESRIVHWSLPAFPPELAARKRASEARLIRSRVENHGDAIFSRGFSGACHPLLSLDELEKELSWGVKNPWATGVEDVFEIRPSILAPSQPDLARPAVWAAYRAHGYAAVGIAVSLDKPPAPPPQGCFFYTRVSAADDAAHPGSIRLLKRLLASPADVFLMIDLTGLSSHEPLKVIMNEVTPVLQTSGLFPVGTGAAAPATFALDWAPFTPPRLRAAVYWAAPLSRKKRKKNEEYADLLGRMAGTSAPAPEKSLAPEKGRQARLVAHMLGEVSLAGNTFDVRLAGGRFCGATRHGRDLLPRRLARSFLRVDGRTIAYKTTSSFSFEGDSGTGLREELRADGRSDASLSLEYAFCDDSSFLTITGEIRYPTLPANARVDEYAPFSLALREVGRGESVKIQILAPDGSESVATLTEGSDPVFLPGAAFRIPGADGGWINLRFSPVEDRRWGLPSFRIVRVRGAWLLECNPFGSYTPVSGADLSARQESLTLLIGLEETRA